MHHLSILVSVCMRKKDGGILNVAPGDGEAVNSLEGPGPRFDWKVYCGWIPLAKSEKKLPCCHVYWSKFSEDNHLKMDNTCDVNTESSQIQPLANNGFALKLYLQAGATQHTAGIYSHLSHCHVSLKGGRNNNGVIILT